MVVQLSQWSSGISLGWALFSTALGLCILVVIGVKLWTEHRETD